MNSHIQKIKIYVILTAIFIAMVGAGIAYALERNVYFTPDYAWRHIKSMFIEREFQATYPQAASQEDVIGTTRINHSRSVPVIVYHGIPESNIPDTFGISIEKFKDQLFALKKAGYETITTNELYR